MRVLVPHRSFRMGGTVTAQPIETGRGFAVLNRLGVAVITVSHRDIAEAYAKRAGGELTVAAYVTSVTYEPITERAAA